MIRRALLVLVLAVAVLAVVADRLTEQAATRGIAVQVRSSAQLAADPSVSIAGFPFLTQTLRGRLREIDVTTHGIHRGGLRLETVSARFAGVHTGLAAAVGGRLRTARIDRASGAVEVSYADLDAYLADRHAAVVPAGPVLRTTATVTVTGRAFRVGAQLRATVRGAVLSLTPTAGSVTGDGLTAPVIRAATAALTVAIRLVDLPFGLMPQAVAVTPTALSVSATAVGPLVPVPADAARS